MKRFFKVSFIFIFLFSVLLSSAFSLGTVNASAGDDGTHGSGYAADRVIVKMKDNGIGGGALRSVNPFAGLGVIVTDSRVINPGGTKDASIKTSPLRSFGAASGVESDNVFVLTIDTSRQTLKEALRALNKSDRVEIAEPDYEIFLEANNPSGYDYQKLYGLTQIKMPQAWAITTGDANFVVGIVDSGITLTHPDLKDNLWTNPNPNGYGYTGALHGYDFVNKTGTIIDNIGHGTHVAGTVGASGRNGTGLFGVMPNVQLAALKVFNSSRGSVSDAIEGINYATNAGIPVLNNSWGGNFYSEILDEAIINYPGVFVVAAGNDNSNNDRIYTSPANCKSHNVISVAASDNTSQRAYFSNYGKKTVHIAAPGLNIYSAWPYGVEDHKDIYNTISGTSMAAPHATGVAALIVAKYPSLTPTQVKWALINGATKGAQWTDITYGGGILNAYESLLLAATYSANPGMLFPPFMVYGGYNLAKNAVDLSWDRVDGATSYEVYYGDGNTNTKFGDISAPANSCKITGLNPAINYKFAVVTVKGGEKSQKSIEMDADEVAPGNVIESVMKNAVNGADINATFRITALGANPAVQVGEGSASGFDYNTSVDPALVSGTLTVPKTIVWEEVTFKITAIGGEAFAECDNLTSVIIPDTVTSIGDSAFELCTSLSSIVMPDTVKSIGICAFEACKNLKSIDISMLTKIGIAAFYNSGITSIVIPNAVTAVNASTFEYCADLESVTIGSGVKSLGQFAFAGCTSLTSITNLAQTPQSLFGSIVFDGNASNMFVFVPKGRVQAYINAGWVGFKKVVEIGTDVRPELLSVSISGQNKIGSVLTANAVLNEQLSSAGLSYQWQSAPDNISFSNIEGATASKYTVIISDQGKYLRVVVTSDDTNVKPGSVESPSTAKIPSTELLSVTISGENKTGAVLTANAVLSEQLSAPGLSYQWQSSPDNISFTNITGATAATYTVKKADEGKYLRVVVTSNNTNIKPGSVESPSTAKIPSDETQPPIPSACGSVSVPSGGGITLLFLALTAVLLIKKRSSVKNSKSS